MPLLYKKFIFFYSLFHLIAYSCFLLSISPNYHEDNSRYAFEDYNDSNNFYIKNERTYFFLVPDYEVLSKCPNCELNESENFWPFHKFTFAFGSGGSLEHYGFVGVFGFYGHQEFALYVLLPLLVILLLILYRKFVQQK